MAAGRPLGDRIMRRNIGIIDQTIRAILGLALIALAAQNGIPSTCS